MPQLTYGRLLVGAVIAALVGIGGTLTFDEDLPVADMRLSPQNAIYEIDETFTASVVVNASTPTNVYSGIVEFSPELLQVESIDYNTSLADLWAIEPWYSNGDGTVTYAGGTTRPGGFTGESVLLHITFRTLAEGEAVLSLSNARILKHDGLGSDVSLTAPIDAVFTVEPEKLAEQTITYNERQDGRVAVMKEKPSTDLNGDGKQGFVDTSIFMSHLATQNLRSDFNGDGTVNLTDLSILSQ